MRRPAVQLGLAVNPTLGVFGGDVTLFSEGVFTAGAR